STPIVLSGPFFELFFKREAISDYVKDDTRPESIRQEVRLLHDFMQKDKNIQDIIKEYNTTVLKGNINVNNLWTVFPPNELLFLNGKYSQECWLCRDIQYQDRLYSWEIQGIRLGYDGRRIGLAKTVHMISFKQTLWGTMELLQLPLVPFRYLQKQDQERIRAQLIGRGLFFREVMAKDLQGFACKEYTGPSWKSLAIDVPPTTEINERVVADYKSFLDKEPDQAPELVMEAKRRKLKGSTLHGVGTGTNSSDSSSDDSGEEEESETNDVGGPEKDRFEILLQTLDGEYNINKMVDLLLLSPAHIPAYGLKTKIWHWVLLEDLKPTNFNDQAFELLQLDPMTKNLVKALVNGAQSHQVDDDFDDAIRGKGKGLMILLYGKPGMVKTFTAETIAELTKSPLYTVSGGELSTNVTKVEEKLNEIFKLSKRWRAIVLLDEADVVMSKRTSAELDRNARVAVWLRMIEYFEGVFFLTTNRHGDLDEAFQSRGNLTVNMPVLTQVQRAKIWENLIRVNKRLGEDPLWKDKTFHILGKLEINGRAVKNMLRTAEYFARSTQKKLTVFHVNEVLKVELSTDEIAREVCRELEEMIQGQSDKHGNPDQTAV
ncbi:P-loop containing nucleoside triphosphate hydrolase protein, partial [Ustulina deusta]